MVDLSLIVVNMLYVARRLADGGFWALAVVLLMTSHGLWFRQMLQTSCLEGIVLCKRCYLCLSTSTTLYLILLLVFRVYCCLMLILSIDSRTHLAPPFSCQVIAASPGKV